MKTNKSEPKKADLNVNDKDYYDANSPWGLIEINKKQIQKNMTIRFVVGDEDSTLENNRQYCKLLNQLNITHTLEVLPGVGHNSQKIYNKYGEKNWKFYHNVFTSNSEVKK